MVKPKFIKPMIHEGYRRYLPSAYDSSMSIYEELTIIHEYLNQLIVSQNELIGYVDENLKIMYENIKQMMEEIERFEGDIIDKVIPENLKKILEEWLEDGTLAEIINQSIGQSLLDMRISLKDYGAKGDCETDDTAAIERAIADSVLKKLPIFVPNGCYKSTKDFDWKLFYGYGKIALPNKSIRFSQLPSNYGKSKFQRGIDKNKNTYGTFNNATVASFIANVESEAQVLGIEEKDISYLSKYGDRDSCAIFGSNSTSENHKDFTTGVVFTEDTVTVPDLEGFEVKEGMIIDTLHTPKFSGYVTKVDGNTIHVLNGWYQNNSECACPELPPNTAGIRINPTTKIWGMNVNIHLEKDHLPTAGAIAEFGVFNEQESHQDDVVGVDMLSGGKGRVLVGYRARTLQGKGKMVQGFLSETNEQGFRAVSCDISYTCDNAVAIGYLSQGSPVAFQSRGDSKKIALLTEGAEKQTALYNDGTWRNFGLSRATISDGGTIDPTNTSLAFVQGGSVTLGTAKGVQENLMKIINYSANECVINANAILVKGIQETQVRLKSFKTLELFSDGDNWIFLDGTDPIVFNS